MRRPTSGRIRVVGVLVVGVFGVVGCSQMSMSGDTASPTGPSAVLGAKTTVAAAASGPSAGPGATYNATGLWSATITRDGEHFGEGVHAFTQDAEGNIVGVGTEHPEDPEFDPGTYTFTRLGAGQGARTQYRLTITSPDPPGPDCGRNLSGVAQLNPATNTIEARRVTGTVDNCSTMTLAFTWAKLP